MFEFILSILPIVVLLISLLVIKLPAPKASALAFSVTMAEFILIFKPGLKGIGITMEKGLVMGVFMGLIAFGAMMLYNLVDAAGGFASINKFLSRLIEDRFVLFLMMCWTFSAFLQGIAGYGLPAVIAATVLIKSGYDATKSAAAALIGHSWAISFGTMGSSIYAIDLVTTPPLSEILGNMAKYGSLGMLCCGLGVCFVYGGFKYVIKGIRYIVPSWITMSLSLSVLASFELVSVMGFVTGIIGVATMVLTYKMTSGQRSGHMDKADKKRLFDGVLPYVLVIFMSIGFAVINPNIKLAFSFPGYETVLGDVVEAQEEYVVFNIFKYPFSIILIASIICMMYYKKNGILAAGNLETILKKTGKKIYATEIVLVLLFSTAQMMMDGGMIKTFSDGIVKVAGNIYPLMATLVGATGTFITGSNTNSNVLFGSLQENAAVSLGLIPSFMCAAQSISASVAGAISPTTTALTAAAAGKSGKENEVYRYTIVVTVFTAIVLGIMNMIINFIIA